MKLSFYGNKDIGWHVSVFHTLPNKLFEIEVEELKDVPRFDRDEVRLSIADHLGLMTPYIDGLVDVVLAGQCESSSVWAVSLNHAAGQRLSEMVHMADMGAKIDRDDLVRILDAIILVGEANSYIESDSWSISTADSTGLLECVDIYGIQASGVAMYPAVVRAIMTSPPFWFRTCNFVDILKSPRHSHAGCGPLHGVLDVNFRQVATLIAARMGLPPDWTDIHPVNSNIKRLSNQVRKL